MKNDEVPFFFSQCSVNKQSVRVYYNSGRTLSLSYNSLTALRVRAAEVSSGGKPGVSNPGGGVYGCLFATFMGGAALGSGVLPWPSVLLDGAS